MQSTPDGQEVVATLEGPTTSGPPPLLVLDRVTQFLDLHGLGQGPLSWERVGDGQSNITFHVRRGDLDLVLRRGPRPPLPPSTHDMVREARIQRLLHTHEVPVPEILAVCEDEATLGVPFYVMEWLDGVVITERVPPVLESIDQRGATSHSVIETLVRLHSVDVSTGPLRDVGRPDGFLARQVRRFAGLWEVNTTRVLPEVAALADWLTDNLPTSQTAAVVHGDYRLGNLMFDRAVPATTRAVLDWEMATLGDPLTDLGYLLATWSEPTSMPHPLQLSPVTASEGYLGRAELADAYAERTGLDLTHLPWYETLALWKGAVFCEAIYTRWLRGERPHDTSFGPSLEAGVPVLLAAAHQAKAGRPTR